MAKTKKDVVFNEDGTLDEKSNRLVTDDKGYLGCWFTDKRKDKYFVRVGETVKEAWSRYYKYLISQPIKSLKKKISRQISRRKRSGIFKGMTPEEIAMWNERISEVKNLGYWVYTLSDGSMLVKIETEYSNKLIITKMVGNQTIPLRIYSFNNADDLDDYIEELKTYGKK